MLVLEDGFVFEGQVFGLMRTVSGEVVFNTGMVGYPEALTDPSYRGQILVLTFPLIGNYGVPADEGGNGLATAFESDQIHVQGLVVSQYSGEYSHWKAARSLGDWLVEHRVPGLSQVDTRMLTKRLREKGTMRGKIRFDGEDVAFHDPNAEHLVSLVSGASPARYEARTPRVVVIDCGCKHGIIRSLLARGISVLRVPWDYDFFAEEFDGVVISNGPGDPKMCQKTIRTIRRLMDEDRPIFGICLGHQLLALAAGADTYKLKFGHRGQNQPCTQVGTRRCYVTSQNHGYAVVPESLPPGWEAWFVNANDGTNEGIRHISRPFRSVQFHPEASPGPLDTGFLFDEFLSML
jgi:carbamoyl-phosphate synthase small subunit